MLDSRLIRNDPDLVRQGLARRGLSEADALVNELLELDETRRAAIGEVNELKARRNEVSKRIGELKRAGEAADQLQAEMGQAKQRISELDALVSEAEARIDGILMGLPNLPLNEVPEGGEEANQVIREWGDRGSFDFDPKPHWELGEALGILDLSAGSRISGSGFPVLRGAGARLQRNLIDFMLNLHVAQHGYTEVRVPYLVNRDALTGTGQLPKMEDDMYAIEKDELYPIPTAEVPITNLHRDEMVAEKDLPIRYVGYSACFRREAGSYGKESKGFLRVHQFNKVEMVKIVKSETSYDELENLVNDAEDILKALKIPYRIIMLCTGDLSFSAAKCYDIETWSLAEQRWLEASSCSNFEDFQARRANIRFKRDGQKKPEFVHTLNGSGLATSRLMVSLLETYQTPEGTVKVPEVLQKYTGFSEIK